MTNNSEITCAHFESDKFLISISPNLIQLFRLQPMQSIFSLSGGPYVHASYSGQYLFAVSNTRIPPFMSNFVLTYSISSGSFERSIEFGSPILSLHSTKSYLFVSLQSNIQVVDIQSFQIISSIERRNELGILAVSEKYIIYTNDEVPGTAIIAAIPGFSVVAQVQCHKDPINFISISEDGNSFITASSVGTLVRQFHIHDGKKLDEFRRGYTQSTILSAFLNDLMLVCISTSTLHIFLKDKTHIIVHLPCHAICCRGLGSHVAVVGVDAILSMYKVDGIGGSAKVLTQHRLLSATLQENRSKGNNKY